MGPLYASFRRFNAAERKGKGCQRDGVQGFEEGHAKDSCGGQGRGKDHTRETVGKQTVTEKTVFFKNREHYLVDRSEAYVAGTPFLGSLLSQNFKGLARFLRMPETSLPESLQPEHKGKTGKKRNLKPHCNDSWADGGKWNDVKKCGLAMAIHQVQRYICNEKACKFRWDKFKSYRYDYTVE
nr:hypothetical protein Iba_chr05fCG9700 [Ipomoea batatas]